MGIIFIVLPITTPYIFQSQYTYYYITIQHCFCTLIHNILVITVFFTCNLLFFCQSISIIFKTESPIMSPPNWDDDFDFDDDAPKKKAVPDKKKVAKDNDFFDDDNSNKLPSIGSKANISKQIPQNKRNSAKQNPYAQNMKLRGNIYDDDENVYEQIEEQPKAKVNTKSNGNNSKKKQVDNDIEYYEDIEEPSKKQVTSKKQIKQDNKKTNHGIEDVLLKKFAPDDEEHNYQEEVFEDNYGDDFQQPVEEVKSPPKKKQPVIHTDPPSKKSIVNQNKIQSIGNQNNSNNANSNQKKVVAPPKPPSRNQKKQQPGHRNLTVEKGGGNNIPRSQSRHSMKSAESKRPKQSRVNSNKLSTNISFVANKYSNQIEKSFPDVNLNEMNQDKLNKLNQKLRGMIKKFNEQLNELINKNMMYLKAKKNQKSVNVDNKLKVLEEQSKNNETMLEVMQKQFDKLSGRDGELREEQYQLMTERKIEEAKQSIKQAQKMIVKLKTQIKSEGNKLTNKNEDKKLIAELHHLKTTLIQAKKDEEKHNQKIQKLDEQMEDLGQKITDIEYKLSQMIDKARQKGIQLESNQEVFKKFDTIKKRVDASRNHRMKLENLLKTKSDIISHEKEQMKINIKNCELQIKNLYDSISHVHNQSVKIVEKAKVNPKLMPNIVGDLDCILKSLQLVPPDNYSVRSQENRSQHSNRPLKNIVIGNMEKSEPQKRSQSANNDKHTFNLITQQDNSKPNLLKKKFKNDVDEQKKNEVNQRVWRDDEKEKEAKKETKKQVEVAKQKESQKVVEEEKDKKKPFTLKKNRVGGDSKPTENKIQIEQKNDPPKLELEVEKKPEQEKKEQISLAGPRMMKFKRRTNEQKQKQGIKDVPKQQEKPKINVEVKQEETKPEQQKPTFVPKRFNLRNRQQKKDDAYVPSIQTKQKQEPKKQVKPDPPIEKKTQQSKPKFNFNDIQDSSRKPLADPFEKKDQSQKNTILPVQQKKEEEQVKPKFNLRLRDRKKNNDESGYNPTLNENKPAEQKPSLNLGQNKNTSVPQENMSNPYAPKENINNPYAPKQNTTNPYAPKQPISNPYAPKENNLNLASNRQNPATEVKKPDQVPPNNPNNPYAQNQADLARKKQGPIKKPKLQQQGQKQKINIYEQAQQAEGLNQFVHEPKKEPQQQNFNPIATKDLNLNDLLGVKNKKNNDDLADLLGGGSNNKKAKKNNDFFGDLDL